MSGALRGRPMRSRARARRSASGLGIVTAIFLLVALAGLGAAIVSVTSTQANSAAQDQLGARAYQSARAGIEWALFKALRSTTPATPAASLPTCTNGTGYSFVLPPNTTLASFSVTVTCEQVAAGSSHFWIRATACNEPDSSARCPNTSNPSAEYVQRIVEVQL